MKLAAKWVFLRSMLSSGAATVVDLGTLTLLVSIIGVPARIASVPALLCSQVVNFIANRRFAFRSKGSAKRQVLMFAAVQSVTVALNAVLFDVAMRGLGDDSSFYWVARLVISNAVYLAWSFPMFKAVFR